ncbi:MAG: bifunctional glutamate N-acetyltransferase/amino-acid acetyltransferase ArgJ [Armatimonadetes bacterium]|nr:bifunctional glutamate N-acetyltransferase/amino-acid acetyltransferase ArgJ [Armatimonadota bacterium]
MLFEIIEGGVLAAEGFTAAATCAGIKQDGILDMVLIHSDRPAAAAATLTQNVFRAAPTYVTQAAVANGVAQTIIVNSGNANCATGSEGLANARRMGELAAELTGVPAADTIVCSTGRIGVPLPMDKVEAGIHTLAGELSREDPVKIAKGILTTDTVEKISTTRFAVPSGRAGVPPATVHLGAICKGAGMICPNMATMLCFITTDLAIDADLLKTSLQEAVKYSFNCCSVDGDMSTNDTVAILANGAAGNAPLTSASDEGYAAFRAALGHVTKDLAQQIVRDGEEVSKFLEIVVQGAADYDTAHALAHQLATYLLFQTCLYGGDFNWGRVAAALGSSMLPFDPGKMSIEWQGITCWNDGEPQPFNQAAAEARLEEHDQGIIIDLKSGDAVCTYWTNDITPEYVSYNAH